MIGGPPRITRTVTRVPDTTPCRARRDRGAIHRVRQAGQFDPYPATMGAQGGVALADQAVPYLAAGADLHRVLVRFAAVVDDDQKFLVAAPVDEIGRAHV